jgi:hypothetical protein
MSGTATGRVTRYLSLGVWPARQASNAASACSRSSALLSRRGGCLFEGVVTMGVPPLTSSTPCLRIRRRCFIADQFVRAITHLLSNTPVTQQSRRGKSWRTPAALLSAPDESMRKGNIVGSAEPGSREASPVRPRYHTPALRGLSTNWVDINFSPATYNRRPQRRKPGPVEEENAAPHHWNSTIKGFRLFTAKLRENHVNSLAMRSTLRPTLGQKGQLASIWSCSSWPIGISISQLSPSTA